MEAGMTRRVMHVCCIALIMLVAAYVDAQISVTNDRWEREPGFTYPDAGDHYTPTPFKPRQYVAYRTAGDIFVDGKLDETSWDNAEWTDNFRHIVYWAYKNPSLNTRAKMVWDDENLYFAGYLEEPNIYAHLTKNDTIVCHESDFEIFMDVDGDARKYIEIEFNAVGTVWDMTYEKELDKGALPKSWAWIPGSEPWDVEGMRLAVRTHGTLNYPYDVDKGWSFECSIPWRTLEQHNLSGESLAQRGSCLRVNFSRVQFNIKEEWPITDWKPVRGVDWLWSPMFTYRAHVTETFGRIILSDKTVLRAKDWELENAYPFLEPPKPPRKPKTGSMVKVKGGTYPIGPDDNDPSGASPAGSVTVDDFYMDRYEVTIGEYAAFLDNGGNDDYYWEDMADPDFCGIVKKENGSYDVVPGKELYPVCFIKIEGAKAYATWAGKRLPDGIRMGNRRTRCGGSSVSLG